MFYVHVLSMLFNETGILNRSLQSRTLDIKTALDEAGVTIQALIEKKNDPQVFEDLIATVIEFAKKKDIQVPSTTNQRGRKSNASKRQRTESMNDPIERYRGYYTEIVDMFIEELSQKFHVDSYKPLIAISNLIISMEKPQISDVFFDLGVYRREIEDMEKLDTELSHWYRYKSLHNIKTIPEVHNSFAKNNLKILYPNIFILLTIFLTVPVTSAEGERAFSCLKRIKSCLRTTMNQVRLSSVSIINIHSIIAAKLNIEDLIDIFASLKERRLQFH